MRVLVTLDFPPERGGIQQYLHGIVRFGYGADDVVLVGCTRDLLGHDDGGATPVKRVTAPFASVNKKIAILGLFVPLITLSVRYRRRLTIECGNLYAAIAPYILSRTTGLAYRVYTYGTELLPLQRLSVKTAFLRSVLRRAHRIYALGSYTQRLLEKAGIRGTIEIVPPRIVLPPPEQTSRQRTAGVFSILSVGRLVEHKGHTVLVEAAGMLPQECNWKLVIVGSGPRKEALVALCGSVRNKERISLRENLAEGELRSEYRRADVVVLPSLETAGGTEGFGIVLLEAMAYHVPVVASSTGGIVEVLDNGSCLQRP